MLWAAGNKQALKYFGITEATTRNPLLANTANNSTAVIPAAGTVIATTAAPVQSVVATTEEADSPDDGDGEESKIRNLQKLAQ